MTEERVYTCLVCPDRPVIHGKVAASLHLRAEHLALLEYRHPDELLLQGPCVDQAHVVHHGPYVCLCVAGDGSLCEMVRVNLSQMDLHLVGQHSIKNADQEYGEHFVSQTEHETRLAAEEREREAFADREGERAALILESVCGVTDFLTECDA